MLESGRISAATPKTVFLSTLIRTLTDTCGIPIGSLREIVVDGALRLLGDMRFKRQGLLVLLSLMRTLKKQRAEREAPGSHGRSDSHTCDKSGCHSLFHTLLIFLKQTDWGEEGPTEGAVLQKYLPPLSY